MTLFDEFCINFEKTPKTGVILFKDLLFLVKIAVNVVGFYNFKKLLFTKLNLYVKITAYFIGESLNGR